MRRLRISFFIFLFMILIFMGFQFIGNQNHLKSLQRNQYTPHEIVSDARYFSFKNGSLFSTPETPEGEAITEAQEAYQAYRYAKLLQDKYSEYLTDEQAKLLKKVGYDEQQLPITRLYALTSLKLANRETDEQLAQKIARELMDSFPSSISFEEVNNYIQIAEVALDADPFIKKHNLTEYQVSLDAERLTVAVLTYSYLFDNEEEVKNMFPELQDRIREFSLGESENVTTDQYLLSTAALISTQGANYEEISKIREKDAELLRCGESGTFIAMDVSGTEVCSLILTEIYYQRGVWQWSQ